MALHQLYIHHDHDDLTDQDQSHHNIFSNKKA